MKTLEVPKMALVPKVPKVPNHKLKVPEVAGMDAVDETKRITDKLLTRLNAHDKRPRK
jgi:hypothetical protein